MAKARFDWDPAKDRTNWLKHGVDFATAQLAFADRSCVIAEDIEHSTGEKRYFWLLLLWPRGIWRAYRSLHLPRRRHSHFRRRLLAQRKADL